VVAVVAAVAAEAVAAVVAAVAVVVKRTFCCSLVVVNPNVKIFEAIYFIQ
jgi:hypothetical protein